MFIDKRLLKKIILFENSTILEAINNLNMSQLKVILILNHNKKFIGILNDGDIRRAFARGYNINSLVQKIINRKPFIVKSVLDINKISSKKLNQFLYIPIIKKKKIYGLYHHNLNTNIKKIEHKEQVIIMAGGYGKRLGSLTKKCPKALLNFEEKPLLQHILEHIKKNNFYNVQISNFYLKKMIKDFIYNNNSFTLKVKFIEETKALGTIGSLRLIKKISNNFIVMNCDVISDIDLTKFISFHKKKKSLLTIATKQFQYDNPYGVIVSHNNKFISFKEKPKIDFLINTGIYVFNKKILKIMNKFNINNIEDLIIILKKKKLKVLTYQLIENWRDFGSDKKSLKKFNLK